MTKEELIKIKAYNAFDEFLHYFYDSGRITLDELEDDFWREMFKKALEQ